LTEIVFALGAGELLVGVTRFADYPPKARQLPVIGGFINPDLEAIVSKKPDLVLAIRTSGGRKTVDALVRLGVPVLLLPADTIDDLYISIAEVGDSLGRAAQSATLALQLHDDFEEISRVGSGAAAQRVLVLVGNRPMIAAGPGSIIDSLLSLGGLQNAVTRGGAWPIIDVEAVVSLRPELIVDVSSISAGDADGDNGRQALSPSLRDLIPVVRVVDDGLVRVGPRLPAALRRLLKAVRTAKP